jgi:hypothetical protein
MIMMCEGMTEPLICTHAEIICECHHEMSRIAAFMDNFSTTQLITLNKIPLESLGQYRQSSVKFVYLICISSGGNSHMKNTTPLPFLLSVLHFSQLWSP